VVTKQLDNISLSKQATVGLEKVKVKNNPMLQVGIVKWRCLAVEH